MPLVSDTLANYMLENGTKIQAKHQTPLSSPCFTIQSVVW